MSRYPYSYSGSAGSSVRFKKRKSRFTFPEVQLLLTEVKKNRHILVGKFNQGVSGDVKKRTWAALTARINEISECHREIIEIIKKWSDLNCDTKRKVAAMRASGFSAARIAQDLSPIESMVNQILQMPPKNDSTFKEDEDDDEDSQGAFGMQKHSTDITNERLPVQPQGIPLLPPPSLPLVMIHSNDSAVPVTDFSFELSEQKFSEAGSLSDGSTILHNAFSGEKEIIGTETKQQATNNSVTLAGTSSHVALPRPLPRHASVDPGHLQEHLAKSASLSLQEQQATTMLMGTLSRSLESLSVSVQRLVQMQQQFARDTLRLQRDTLHVLRDFSSTSLALLQDKVNGQL
ncbi:myb/SANT-like DNA-binding domain-containing protein 4 isoform X2 [Hoplias malabaricus]|uniref:myb/SANT-like DNA-binding domain-containing protein 4 isoform X2 n=1 Tax=Hoplias malabaricus TaxID=27720 RepID=UPI003461953B